MNVMYFVVQFRRSKQLLVDFVRFDNLIAAVESLRNAERVNKDDDMCFSLVTIKRHLETLIHDRGREPEPYSPFARLHGEGPQSH